MDKLLRKEKRNRRESDKWNNKGVKASELSPVNPTKRSHQELGDGDGGEMSLKRRRGEGPSFYSGGSGGIERIEPSSSAANTVDPLPPSTVIPSPPPVDLPLNQDINLDGDRLPLLRHTVSLSQERWEKERLHVVHNNNTDQSISSPQKDPACYLFWKLDYWFLHDESPKTKNACRNQYQTLFCNQNEVKSIHCANDVCPKKAQPLQIHILSIPDASDAQRKNVCKGGTEGVERDPTSMAVRCPTCNHYSYPLQVVGGIPQDPTMSQSTLPPDMDFIRPLNYKNNNNAHITTWLRRLCEAKQENPDSPDETQYQLRNYLKTINWFDTIDVTFEGIQHGETRGYDIAVDKLTEWKWKERRPKIPFKLDVGSNAMLRLYEILNNGTLPEVEKEEERESVTVTGELVKVHGIGAVTAKIYREKGIRGYADLCDETKLKQAGITLSANQLIGVKHYYDFLRKIPRQEIEAMRNIVLRALDEVNVECGIECKGQATGSYRRGKAECGDMDILIVNPSNIKILSRVVHKLQEKKFITDVLTHYHGMPFREDKYGPPTDVDERGKEDIRESWMGVCQLHATGYFRRIDIKVYSPVQYPFALLAFTGNAHFNRSLRFWAKKLGYSLSDHGIKINPKAEPFRLQCALKNPLPLPDVCYTEADVLNRFGIDFIAPERRH